MKRLALVLFIVVCCASFIGNAYAGALIKGDVVYTRSSLRAEGNKIFFHNMRSLRELIPVGTEAKITKCEGGIIGFNVIDTNKTYYVYANSEQWDKFFVKDRKEIGLDKFSPDAKAKVMNCEISNGMTKEEVYASKGCPAYIAWGKTTERNSLADIMRSDKWYYNISSRGHDVMVTFENGVVVKTGGFEK